MSELDLIITDAKRVRDEADRLIRRVEMYKVIHGEPKNRPLKLISGRLSDHGIRVCEAALERGDRVSEIARMLDITIPAVMHRRASWLRRQTKRK
jgi:hypothetical protein